MPLVKHSLLLERVLSFKDPSPLVSIKSNTSQSSRYLYARVLHSARKARFHIVHALLQNDRELVEDGDDCFGLQPDKFEPSPKLWDLSRDIAQKYQKHDPSQKLLVAIDSLQPLLITEPARCCSYLTKFMSIPNAVLVYSYNPDIIARTEGPSVVRMLDYMATTILTVSPLQHRLLDFTAEQKSLPSPISRDLDKDGNVNALGSNSSNNYIICEHRRRSGRPLIEHCVLLEGSIRPTEEIAELNPKVALPSQENPMELEDVTFNLSLTDKQRQAKEGVALPHFKMQETNQAAEHTTEGIYYTPDSGDDYDEEEADEDIFL